MIQSEDLKAAVSAGILNEGQAASLTALAHSRSGARENLSISDEPFELFKGFNEIFIVVGLLILTSGWVAFSAISIGTQFANVTGAITFRSLISAAVLWALSEYFVRRRRMVAPAIVLSGLFAINAGIGLNAQFSEPFMVMQDDISSLPFPLLLTTGATFLFWLRFRVPIALAFVALALFASAVLFSASQGRPPETLEDFFLLSSEGSFAWLTLVLGLGTFAVAMGFDMSDPHRVSRRSANGFWLHVIAAPAIVNTVALSLLSSESDGNMTILIAFLALMAIVAIVIDRRSFLITGVGYVVAVASTLSEAEGTAVSVLILGLSLLLLGAFWEKIRSILLGVLGPVLPLKRLPPSSKTAAHFHKDTSE